MTAPTPGSGLVEVADRVWVGRDTWLGANVTVVQGAAGLLVVDAPAGVADLVAELRALDPRGVTAVALTHGHPVHTGGLGALRAAWPDAAVHAHEEAARAVPEVTRTFSSVGVVDLGDRSAELVHPGRAHTDGDLVVTVPDADVVAAGDLLDGDGCPHYAEDSHPLDWPAGLDLVVGLLTGSTVVVPGHGAPVDKAFAADQRADVALVADTVHGLVSRAVPVGDALAAAAWPFPADRLEHAVRRGYEQVPRPERHLPLA